MPIYEYACTNCEHAFDELQKISDAALVHCPQCDEPALRKKLSAPKFRLKGQGWYETDFKTGDKRNLAGDGEGKPKAKTDAGDSKAGAASGKTEAAVDKKPPVKKAADSKETSA
ncbi:MAG: zinc ribbon domain-containing protein [Gammaproteobacteria bacterium]|nr:zinc ribbon domain-containing protein [Gammaproteobacteria bacterium]